MTLLIQCQYCGRQWERWASVLEQCKDDRCGTCHDPNLKIRVKDKARIDSYKGCPPFPGLDAEIDRIVERLFN